MVTVKGIIKAPIKLLIIFFLIIYILSPIDLLPEGILGPFGLIDDLIAVMSIFGVWRGQGVVESIEKSIGKLKGFIGV